MLRRSPFALLPCLLLACACSSGDGKKKEGERGPGSGGAGSENEPGEQPDVPPEFQVKACEVPSWMGESARLAVQTGDARKASFAELVEAYDQLMEAERSLYDQAIAEIYRLGENFELIEGESLSQVYWDPTHDAITLRPTFGKNAAFMLSNSANSSTVRTEALAVLGEKADSRYLVFGSNPFRLAAAESTTANDEMRALLQSAVNWVTEKNADESLDVVFSHLDQSYFFPDEVRTRAWFDENRTATYNEENACDGAELRKCLEAKPDLLVISQAYDEDIDSVEEVESALRYAQEQGISVIYIQWDGSVNALGEALLAELDVERIRDNYWDKLTTDSYSPTDYIAALPSELGLYQATLGHLQKDDFSFEVAEIAEDPSASESYVQEFVEGTETLRNYFARLDGDAEAIFTRCDSLFDKLLILAADRLRQDVSYPLSATTTSTLSFLRAYFSDHVQYMSRSVNPAQPDRGNFDLKDLSGVEGQKKSRKLESRDGFRAAGVYALPGKALVVRRVDESDVEMGVFVNSVNNRATHVWDEDGYKRPRFLRSATLPLSPGEEIVITSHVGGPVQIDFDSGFGQSVELEFENIGLHPYYRSSEDADSFKELLAANQYNWVEVATDGFELHSRRELFDETLALEYVGDVTTLAQMMQLYAFDHLHGLAAFQGEGITEIPAISDWAEGLGHSLEVMDWVKHGNMDQAGCGSGCSGNPYDAYWSFDPVGHGDLHELGHQLELGRFRLSHDGSTYGGHSVTNWWAFYGADRHFAAAGIGGSWSVTHDGLFAELQARAAAGESVGDFSSAMDQYLGARAADGNLGDAYAFYLQVMLQARNLGALENGYHLVGRLHVLDEAFRASLADEESFNAVRTNLGMSQFAYADAQALSNNDVMALFICFSTGLDYRDYFKMWGLTLSASVDAQIASFAGTVVPRVFFALDKNDHTRGALSEKHSDFQKLPIDGTTAWPL